MKAEADFMEKLAEMRSRTYWFLSTLYLKKPDTEMIEDIKLTLSELDNWEDDLTELIVLLRESLDGDAHELSQRLAAEFTRLFRGISKGYGPPPPYESVYRGEGRVMGETTLSVLKFYNEAGMGIIDENEGPQDYIGIELKFMSLLCYREMESWRNRRMKDGERYLELEKRFLNEHLLQWVPDFCRRVEAESREEFFATVAMLTEKLLRIDAENIEVLLDKINRD